MIGQAEMATEGTLIDNEEPSTGHQPRYRPGVQTLGEGYVITHSLSLLIEFSDCQIVSPNPFLYLDFCLLHGPVLCHANLKSILKESC
jgi:hypothetical protein